jgi:hypothetical protein
MLPNRKSAPPKQRRRPDSDVWVVDVEVRLPDEGTWFPASAASIGADGIFLSTLYELVVGTVVILELSLPDGAVVVDGIVVPHAHDARGPGIRVVFQSLTNDVRERIEALHQSGASFRASALLVSQVA